MSTPRDSIDCAGCPACVWAEKEKEAAEGKRCRICLTTFDEPWPVQSETQPDLCRRCASAAPSKSRPGATYGRFNPEVGVDVPEKPGGDAA